jgi:hypothetical protein
VLGHEPGQARLKPEHRSFGPIADHEDALCIAGHDADLDRLEQCVGEALPAGQLAMGVSELAKGLLEGSG